MTDEQLLREAMEALQDLTPKAKQYFIEYTPTTGQDFANGALIRKANLVIAKLEERLLRQ